MPFKDPEKQREYNRQYQRKRRAGLTGTTRTTPVSIKDPYNLDELTDLIEIMRDALNIVKADEMSTGIQKARALAYCCSVSAKLIETIDATTSQQEDNRGWLHRDIYHFIKDDPVALDNYFELHRLASVRRRPFMQLVMEYPDAKNLMTTIINSIGAAERRKREALKTTTEGPGIVYDYSSE